MSAADIIGSQGDRKLLRKIYTGYFISSLLAILFMSLGQIFNGIVVGNTVGSDKLAVMSLVLPVYYVFATVGNLAGVGGSALCAKLMGERRFDECKKVYTATYLLTVLLSVVFAAVFLCVLPYISRFLGAGEELYGDVTEYAGIMIMGGVFTACIYLSFNFLRIDNHPVATVMTFVIMSSVNIVFDVLLTSVIPLGIAGISLAAVLGAAAASVYGVVLISVRGSGLLGFTRMSPAELFKYGKKVMAVGSPGAAENMAILLRSYLLNSLILSSLGSAVLSELSVVNSVNSFALSIIAGGAGALIPLAGVLSSERDTGGIRRLTAGSLFMCGAILVCFMIPVFIFAPQIANVFGIIEPQSVSLTAAAIRIFLISLPLSLLSNMLIYLHIADGHTAVSNILTVLRNLVFSIGSAFLLVRMFDENGLWISFAACEAATLAAAAVIHLAVHRKKPVYSRLLLLDESCEKSGASYSVCVRNNKDDIMRCVDSLGEFSEKNELSPKRTMLVTLAAEELLLSVGEHSLSGTGDDIMSVRLLIWRDVLIFRIRNGGRMFNPIAYYEQHISEKNDVDSMLDLGDSLGLKMVVDACDVVDYRTTFGINNLTVIL